MHLFWDLYGHTVNTKKNLSWWRRPTSQASKHRHKEKYLRIHSAVWATWRMLSLIWQNRKHWFKECQEHKGGTEKYQAVTKTVWAPESEAGGFPQVCFIHYERSETGRGEAAGITAWIRWFSRQDGRTRCGRRADSIYVSTFKQPYTLKKHQRHLLLLCVYSLLQQTLPTTQAVIW